MAKKVTKYESKSGRVFDTENEANLQDNKDALIAIFEEMMYRDISAKSLVEEILDSKYIHDISDNLKPIQMNIVGKNLKSIAIIDKF